MFGDYKFLNHSRSSEKWTLQTGYEQGVPLDTFPFRALGVGPKMGVNINLTIDLKHFDTVCKGLGYRLALHSPDEIPQLSTFYRKLPTNSEVIATIQPKMVITADKLRSYRPER
jgi:Amiloride-sensitive sodium channel